MRQKSAKKRAETKKTLEREESETVANQDKADHKLKERLGKDGILDKNEESKVVQRTLCSGQRR